MITLSHASAIRCFLIISCIWGTRLQAQNMVIEPIMFGMHRTTGGLWQGGQDPITFAGGGIRGEIHQGKWSVKADFINMRFFGLANIPSPFSPEQGFSWQQFASGEGDEFDTDYGRLVISYDGGAFQALAGKFTENWGPGLQALTLSEKPPTYPQFGFDWQVHDRVRIIYRHGQLVSRLPDSTRSRFYVGPRQIDLSRYVAAHRLEITPFDNLTVGLTELVIYGTRGLELVYLLPFIPFWHAQHYLGDTDNVQMSADIKWDLRPGWSVYGAFLMDEWRPQDTFKEANRNWFAWQGGLTGEAVLMEGDRLVVEGTWTDHRTYRHRFPVNDAYSHRYPIGPWIGPHAQSLQATYTVPWRDSRWSVAYLYARRGALTKQMLLDQYATELYERFSGETETLGTLEFTAARNVFKKLWVEGSISLIEWDNPGFDPANPAATETVSKTSFELGFFYNFELPGYSISRLIAP